MTLVGLYLSFRLKWPQFTSMVTAWKLAFKKSQDKTFSSFAAVSTVLGGNLGTGNIAGVAVALSQGGPGALFWMWVMAFLGMSLKLTGCVLGILYRKRAHHGKYTGGPMYYLTYGLNKKFLAKGYCLFLLAGALTVGNLVQMNSIALPLSALDVPPGLSGAIMSLLVALVIFGGLRRFSIVITKVVPVMALLYIFACSIILVYYYHNIAPSLLLIIQSAFMPGPIIGGAIGYTLVQVINAGFDRGLFATDAGVGLAPIIHASVGKSPHESEEDFACQQGLISMISPLIVMVVCTMTGLVILVTGALNTPGLESTNMCVEAFCNGLKWEYGGHIVTLVLLLFAYTTILTWSFCADKAMGFLFGNRSIAIFRVIFVVLIPLGALLDVNFVWTTADISMNLMFLVNIIGVCCLAHKTFPLLKKRNSSSVSSKNKL